MARRNATASSSINSPSSRAVRRASISSLGGLGRSGFIWSFECRDGNLALEGGGAGTNQKKNVQHPTSNIQHSTGRGSWHDSVFGEVIGEVFDRVVEQVTDVSDGEAGAGADFLVGKVLVEFQADQFAAAIVEGLQAEPDQADSFPACDLFVRQRLRVSGVGICRRALL